MNNRIALMIAVILPLLSLGFFTHATDVQGSYIQSHTTSGTNTVCKNIVAPIYGCNPDFRDHDYSPTKPCPSGKVNCDGWGDCGSTAPASNCYTTTNWTSTSYDCHYYTVNSYESCGATTFGFQTSNAGVTWHTTSNLGCTDEPLTRACCNTPASSLKINGGTGPVTVTQGNPFNLTWSFSNPGYENKYSCTLSAPAPAGFSNTFASPLSLTSFSGSMSDKVNTLANPSNAGTLYPYTLNCDGTGICADTTNTVNVQVTAQSFTVSATPDGGDYEIGSTVTWSATPYGGYPPYTYSWSGDITGTAQNITKRYGFVGTKHTTLNARDNSGQNVSDTGEINIVDSRIPQ